jgi:CxxC-x17-CxxC domain-containing protein
MGLQEKSIVCYDCGVTFTYSVEELEAYVVKGYAHVHKRCPSCREARKARQLRSGSLKSVQAGFLAERRLFPAVCAQCGKSTQVPFEPHAGRPVYCRDCYNAVKTSR